MMWLVFALVVAFALAEALMIERLWREHRQAQRDFEALFIQVDVLADALDHQLLTREQLHEQLKPAVAAIRESNQIVVETTDALVSTIRDAKAERRKLRDLMAHAGLATSVGATTAAEPPVRADTSRIALAESSDPLEPIAWSDADGRARISSVVRSERRSAAPTRRPQGVAARKQSVVG